MARSHYHGDYGGHLEHKPLPIVKSSRYNRSVARHAIAPEGAEVVAEQHALFLTCTQHDTQPHKPAHEEPAIVAPRDTQPPHYSAAKRNW